MCARTSVPGFPPSVSVRAGGLQPRVRCGGLQLPNTSAALSARQLRGAKTMLLESATHDPQQTVHPPAAVVDSSQSLSVGHQ